MDQSDTEIKAYHLSTTSESLGGASKELITVNNQWAAVGLDKTHDNSKARFTISIDGKQREIDLKWDSTFPKDGMRSKHNIAEFGGVSLACFVMTQILDYNYLMQSEIGEGVDYRFVKVENDEDDPYNLEGIHVEVSGILDGIQKDIDTRVKIKHAQIRKGTHSDESCAVLISCLSFAKSIFETYVHENS